MLLPSPKARKYVEKRFGHLATTYCFDGPGGAHRPYEALIYVAVCHCAGPRGATCRGVARGALWRGRCAAGRATGGDPRGEIAGGQQTWWPRWLGRQRRLGVVSASLDLVFIDGAHDYDSVAQDWLFWVRVPRRGTCVPRPSELQAWTPKSWQKPAKTSENHENI